MKELKFLNTEYPESKNRIDSKANLTWNEIATLLTKYSCAGENGVSSIVSKRCSHCLYRKYRPNAVMRHQRNKCQITGYYLTGVDNPNECEHYKSIPNVC